MKRVLFIIVFIVAITTFNAPLRSEKVFAQGAGLVDCFFQRS